jgi:hypothetical protein
MKANRVCAMTVFAGLSVLFLLTSVGWAHHSAAHYGKTEKTFQGTVVEFKWRNPHVYIVWDSKDESGKVRRWIGELASVTSSIADGMNKDSLKPGDEVVVSAFPSSAGTPESLIRKITKPDGTVLVQRANAFFVER